ncbi:myogenesis-regulating glycosidase-like isoform X2 [Macrobrachium nipponense]|uniref:myogenesis-regulating glycosidase-like isoform X2 n=1 Tax=Macrobrachium nipponense TaxID=159736 RepID=UPI0030C7ECBA
MPPEAVGATQFHHRAMMPPGLLIAGILMLEIQRFAASGEPLIHVESPYNSVTVEEDRILHFDHPKGKARVFLGLTLPDSSSPVQCTDDMKCLDFGGTYLEAHDEAHCQMITWVTDTLSQLKDCVVLDGHWYGGGQQISQPWPIEKVPRNETPYVTADMLQRRDLWYGGVSEPYWISSRGIAVRVTDDTPLFLSLPDEDEDGKADLLCLRAAREPPYPPLPDFPLTLTYYLCSGANVKEVEIDDSWETCYGDLSFNPDKFPDPKKLIDELHAEGFRVTLWVHPFVNSECQSFVEGDQKGHFIQDETGVTQLTSWWQGSSAGLVDFSSPEAVRWWTHRLKVLQKSTGIDSFKFDAGETSWMPKSYVLKNTDRRAWPNVFSKQFVEAVVKFGGMIETRVGGSTQRHLAFVRMLDKDSTWGEDNGLRTLVPSLLHFGILGYPYVLPDMVGGNSYDQEPSEELFLRWAQANTFMPAIQFSILPWRYGDKMTERCQRVTALHKQFSSVLMQLAEEGIRKGIPMARPTWWLCPEEEICLTADQQFLLGDKILVTPIVHEGAKTLTVVIPPGNWKRADTGYYYHGPQIHSLDDITLDSIIYFTKDTEKEL